MSVRKMQEQRILAFWLSGVLIFLFSGLPSAWSRLEFAGFLENRIEALNLNDESPLNPDNRVLELAEISDQLRLRLSVDTAGYSAPGAHARLSYFDTPTDARFRHDAIVDEAFLNLNLPGRVNCILGKKRLAWGSSFLWNPTDVLSPPKNPQDPEPDENREGVFLAQFERAFGDVTLTSVIAPATPEADGIPSSDPEREVSARLERTQWVGKVDWLFAETDLTGLVHYGTSAENPTHDNEWRFGLGFSRVFFGATEIHGEFLGGRGFMRPSLIPGRSRQNDHSIVVGFVLGLHHSFASNTRLILEFYHNDQGYSATEIDEFVEALQAGPRTRADTMPSASNDSYRQYLRAVNQKIGAFTGNLRKNYVYMRLMRPRFDEIFSFETNVLWNLDDRSVLLFAEGEYETTTNILVFLRVDVPVDFAGENTGEFGGLGVRNQSLRLGAKIYF